MKCQPCAPAHRGAAAVAAGGARCGMQVCMLQGLHSSPNALKTRLILSEAMLSTAAASFAALGDA